MGTKLFRSSALCHQGNNLTLALRLANNALSICSFTLSADCSALSNRVVNQRLAELGLARLLNGKILQLSGRGNGFMASAAEIPVLTAREFSLTSPMPGKGALGILDEAEVFEGLSRDAAGTDCVAGA
ncbi:MAG: hypothetical protein GPOALKHO_001307 [Sodalis sp.]|uniref:hypothetical protein n=1 Tax=Sodalis sp. (in: enterobacteria) TaxID=1898979 RepID=UPI003872FA97|nr:MAG: hypothetical protein GPOALKHO_001307 [Sodalis sp.]